MSNSFHDIVFSRHLGFELLWAKEGSAHITYTPHAEHLNSFGVTHGGALMTLLDVCMAMAARSSAPQAMGEDASMGAVTLEMKTSFMRAVQGNQILHAHASVLHKTTTLAFTQAHVLDASGHVCVHATGTFKYIKRIPFKPKNC